MPGRSRGTVSMLWEGTSLIYISHQLIDVVEVVVVVELVVIDDDGDEM